MKRETQSFYEIAVRCAVQRIAGGLDEALDLVALAKQAALSPLHFHHVFRGMVGETPLEMHRRLRLERAATQLATTETPITTIAFDAGYETHESFTRAFRRAYAASPSELRARAHPRTELATRSGVHHRGTADITIQPGDQLMNVSLESMPDMTVASLRHTGPYNTIGETFGRLGQIAGTSGLFALPGVMMVAIYHDDPESVPAAELRADAGIVVPAATKIPSELDTSQILAGAFAKTTHAGPYTHLGDTWARLMGEWIPRSGKRIRDGVSFEVYRNTPMDTKPEDLRTDIYVPITP